ncbi:MAG: ATP-binding cassette domain-containing protein, partial [Verrucomicrobia bacterium]|nr:ATP-binding cassette domain-containing protein [Verrucomicrobiota bacterium]
GIDLELSKGQIHAIMGPNGSGKSTLAHVLMGHPAYEVTAGEVTFKGMDVLSLEPDERSRLGMTVFLSTHQLSVAEEMADRIGIIHQGKFVAVGTREELRKQSGSDGVLEHSFLALTRQEANFTEEKAAVK